MRIDKLILLLAAVVCLCQSFEAEAQSQTTVTGTVKADDGDPLVGAFVVIKGTKGGVLTDIDGKYSIELPSTGKKYVLSFQYIGMETSEVIVDRGRILNVVLKSDNELEGAVITGAYGAKQNREDLVGSAFQVNSEALKSKPVARVDNLLDGMIPGMSISSNTDDASSTRTRLETRIRGEASLSASNEPLWIIDGIIQYTGNATGTVPGMSYTISPLSFIDPSDIESITVLKDADQVAIYGADGANGVILVTTKSGKRNMPLRINANIKYGISSPDYSTMFKMMNAEQYMKVAKEAWVNAGNKASDFPYQDNPYNNYSTTETNWPSQYLGLGNNFYVQISATGGSDKLASSVSGSFYKENNTIQTDNQKRFTLRLRETINFTDDISLAIGLNGSYNINNLFPVSSGAYLYCVPVFEPYNADGSYRLYNWVWDASKQDFVREKFYYNYLPDREYNDNRQRTAVTKADFNFNWNIIKGLKFNSVFGFDYNSSHEDVYDARTTLRGMSNGEPVGSSSKKDASYISWTNSNVIKYDVGFGKNSLDVYAGLEFHDQSNNYSSISGSGFANDHIKEIQYAEKVSEYSSTSISHNRKMSYFGRLNYSFDKRYYLSANLRRDGSSIFGEYSKWGTFWSVGASWNIHNEKFFNAPWVKMLKLKGSFGKSGNSRIDITTATGTYTYSNSYSYIGKAGAVLGSTPNPGLSWESTYQTNLGINFVLANGLDISLEYYDNYTYDLLSKVYVSRVISEDRQYANMGEMDNKGIELSLNADIINGRDFSWRMRFNAAHNDNKITKLYNGRPTSFGSTIWMEGYSSDTYMLIRWAGVDPSDGSPMWYDKDGNLTKIYNYDNRVPGRSSNPVVFGGLSNDIRWKDLTLSFQINYSIGGWAHATFANHLMADGYDIISENQAVEVYHYRWTTPGEASLFPKVSNNSQHSTSYNDRFLYDKTYFNLSNVSLTYSLPSKIYSRIGAKGLSLSLICDNAYLFTPDQSAEFNSYKTMKSGYPVTRTISASLNLSF